MGPVFVGIVIGLFFKLYFATQVQKKMRDYQGEIVKSHSRILQLEEVNTNLEKRLKEQHGEFVSDKVFLN